MIEYFPHDYHARHNPKLIKVQTKLGLEGLGIYWCIIEMLYENGGALKYDIDSITFELRTKYDSIKSVCEDYDLFKIDNGILSCSGVVERLKEREHKSIQSKKAINIRWSKYHKEQQDNTDVLQSNNESNTDVIPEKEIKGNETKRNKTNNTNTPASYDADFLKFWKVVKRDSSKNLAYAEWKKAIKIKDNDFIIKAYQYQLEQHLKTSELKFFKRAENWLKKSLYLNYEDQQIEEQSIPTYQRLTAIHGADIEFYLKYPDIHPRPEGITDEELEECRQEMIKRGML